MWVHGNLCNGCLSSLAPRQMRYHELESQYLVLQSKFHHFMSDDLKDPEAMEAVDLGDDDDGAGG